MTVEGITHSQIHPVLNNQNKSISDPDSFQVNTSIQRCLVKAIALHGLGLYIYSGEDLPEVEQKPYTPDQKEQMNRHILEGDSLALACFLSLVEENVQDALFNSFEKGAKSSGKQTIRDMFNEGRKIMDTLELDILSMLEAEDAQGLLEATAELNRAEKACLAARIGDRKTQDLGRLVKSAKEAA